MLTVLCWLWHQDGGRTPYCARHVNIWADMVSRHLTMPHRIACVTSTPDDIDPRIAIITPPGDFEDIRIPTWSSERPQCLRRVALFRPDAGAIFGERFVSMDLDCVIGGSLDPLFDTDHDFKMYRGTSLSRPYNGSMLLMTAGARPHVYETFSAAGAIAAGIRFVGSDQAWISQALGPGEATWGWEDGVAWYGSERACDEVRLVFFPGNPKPWNLVEQNESAFALEHYRRSPAGRCLILGYGETVWADLEAHAGEKFDAVIASPEAEAHWPGATLFTAINDAQALRVARMHGYDDIVFCGRSERRAA
jgi:hypothetical protein